MPSSPAIVASTSCEIVARDAFALLDGALSRDAHAAAVTHMAGCPRCRAQVASARRLLGAVRRSGRGVRAPDALRERARALLAAWRDEAGVATE